MLDDVWMNMPQCATNYPPGLEYLILIDQLFVYQKLELLEAFSGFETTNKYIVKNSLDRKAYYAVEETDCLTRSCCGHLRSFDMKILTNFGNEVFHLDRPLTCGSCIFPCCLQSMRVSAPPGNILGIVEQEWSVLCPSFLIRNPNAETVLRIEDSFCTISICADVKFKVCSTDGSLQVGKICKHWSGLVRVMFTNVEYFGIIFPMDLEVTLKALMLGACFLIDAMFFEKSWNKESDQPGML